MKRIARVTLAFVFMTTLALAQTATDQTRAPSAFPVVARSIPQVGSGPVQVIYVVPNDRKERDDYSRNLLQAVKHFQQWLSVQLDGHSFKLADQPLRVVKLDKPAAWFSNTQKHKGFNAFSRNTVDALQSLGVARYFDPKVRYLIVVDADLACGQSGTGGSSVAVIEANHFRALSNEPILPSCPTANLAEVQKRCRWVGGIGHELLHTMGLGHSDQFSDCTSSACFSSALMKHGYATYPTAILRPQEKDFLRHSGFISKVASGLTDSCERR